VSSCGYHWTLYFLGEAVEVWVLPYIKYTPSLVEQGQQQCSSQGRRSLSHPLVRSWTIPFAPSVRRGLLNTASMRKPSSSRYLRFSCQPGANMGRQRVASWVTGYALARLFSSIGFTILPQQHINAHIKIAIQHPLHRSTFTPSECKHTFKNKTSRAFICPTLPI